MRSLDESRVLGSVALVDVIDSDASASSARVVDVVESVVSGSRIGVAREIPDLKNPEGLRHLYLATGDRGSATAAWMDEGYPSFSRNVETRVHPLSDIKHLDPRGAYHVFGPPEAVDALVAEFGKLGLRVNVAYPLSYTTLATDYAGDPLPWSLGVMALAVVTLTGASVLLRAKTYAVLRLQGMSYTDILVRDLRQTAGFRLVSSGGVVAVALGVLRLYNDWARLGLFASIALGIAALLTVLVLASHAAVLALVFRVGILSSLKGELPTRAATISLYVVRVPALLLALSIALSVAMAGQNVLKRQENRDAYRSVGEAVSIRLSSAFATRPDELDRKVGPWLRAADTRGEIVVAGRGDLQMAAPNANLPAGEILIANETYVREQQVLDQEGRRYVPEAGGTKTSQPRPVRVLIPASYAPHTKAITKAVSDKLDPGRGRNIPVETLGAKNGQRLFGYNTGALVYSSTHPANEDRSLMRDPIVVVVPNGSDFLTDDAYVTFATQEGVVFPDPGDVLSAIESVGLEDYVSSVSPVGQRIAAELSDAVGDFRMQMFNLALAVTVLLVAGVGICIIYTRKNAQAIFVRHFSGWTFAASHRFVLAVETAIAIVFAIRIPIEVWQQNREIAEFTEAGLPAPFPPLHVEFADLSVIAGLAVVELAVILLALSALHRRIVKEGSSEA
ncbi:bacteriocin-associated integral membrane family protein [Streptomyces spongiicola]|uniref:bacteriocin-associated integral membrane family protein n=1 Tax=Streptomyces spongiicola TaxID=1690221 RepID=UPI0013A5A44C|nr:hypothetical protein [Streptomyces spongiicola]